MTAQQQSKNVWYLDSDCSSHMTGNKKNFIDLDENFNSEVKLGDGKLPRTEGKGTITVQTKGGNKKLIGDVLYVPNLTSNLLSVGQLLRKGYSIFFMMKNVEYLTRKAISPSPQFL